MWLVVSGSGSTATTPMMEDLSPSLLGHAILLFMLYNGLLYQLPRV